MATEKRKMTFFNKDDMLLMRDTLATNPFSKPKVAEKTNAAVSRDNLCVDVKQKKGCIF